MNKFQDAAKVFNSETNLNNFMINNENMKDIIDNIEKEKEKESFQDTPILNPTINNLFKELNSITKVLIKKIIDFQALGRDCRGAGKGGIGESSSTLLAWVIGIFHKIDILLFCLITLTIIVCININNLWKTLYFSVYLILFIRFFECEGFDHLWLSELEIINGRQQLAPKIDSSVKDIERLLVAVINIKEVIIFTGTVESIKSSENMDVDTLTDNVDINYNNDDNNVISDISKIEMIQEIWSKYRSKGAPPTVIEKDDKKNNYGEKSDADDRKNSKKKEKLMNNMFDALDR